MSRGIVYSAISQALFIIGGYIIHVFLARMLGPEKYGVFGICIAIITICHVFLSSGVRQVVSKSVTGHPDGVKYFLNRGIIIQFAISSVLSLLIVIFANSIAHFFGDMGLVNPLYLSAIIIVVQSLFFVYMGVLNGLKKFGGENLLMSVYSVVRTLAAVVLVYLGMGVLGGLSGFVIASVVAVLLGIFLTRNYLGRRYDNIKIGDMLKRSVPIIVIFSAFAFILNADLLAVKYFVRGDEFAGYYTSAAAISQLTYRLLIAFGVVLFPFVSASFHCGGLDQTRKYINEVIRYSLLVTLPIVILFCVYANSIVLLIYGSDYQFASTILRVLVWGLLLLGLSSICSHVMIGVDRVYVMVKYALIGILLSVCANLILVPRIGPIGGAISTTISSCVVVILSYGYIMRRLSINIYVYSVLKVLGALLLMVILSYGLNNVDIHFIYKGIALCIAYFTMLIFLRELGNNDIYVIRRLILNTSK
jgi:stage V sporulation protein B